MLETYFPVFSQQLAFIQHLLEIIRAASIPFLRNVIAQPTLLAHPTQLRERFFMCIWQYMADGVDEAGAESKQDLIFSRASGVVLDLGAGKLLIHSSIKLSIPNMHRIWPLCEISRQVTRIDVRST